MGVALDEALIKLVAAVIVGAVLPYLASWLVAVYDRLFRDLPYVRGTWKTEYKYPREGGPVVEARETGKVARMGRFATAHMRMEGDSKREWVLKGELRGRYWAGKVFAADRKTLSGSGVFQLKILENGRSMQGYMSWYDAALDTIYSTEYKWTKVSKEHL